MTVAELIEVLEKHDAALEVRAIVEPYTGTFTIDGWAQALDEDVLYLTR